MVFRVFLLLMLVSPLSSHAVKLTIKNETKDIYIRGLSVNGYHVFEDDKGIIVNGREIFPEGHQNEIFYAKITTVNDTIRPGESKEIVFEDLLSPSPDHASSVALNAWGHFSTKVRLSVIESSSVMYITFPYQKAVTESTYHFPNIGNLVLKMEGKWPNPLVGGLRRFSPLTEYTLTVSQ